MFEVLYQNLISRRLQEALGGPGRLQDSLLEAAGAGKLQKGLLEGPRGSGRPWEAPRGSPGGGPGLQEKNIDFSREVLFSKNT